MAYKKITDLTLLTSPADDDVLHIVDVSDPTDDASGSSFGLRISDLKVGISGYTNIENKTADYTVAIANVGGLIEVDSPSAVVITVPTDATAAIDIKSSIDIVKMGVGSVTIAAASGVTIRSEGGNLEIDGQNVFCSLVKRGANDWWLVGKLK